MLATLLTYPISDQTFITLLGKCRSILQLKQIHALVLTCGLSSDTFHSTILFRSTIIASSGGSSRSDVDYYDRIFGQISTPTILDWNIAVRAYAGSKNPNKSISLFVRMLRSGGARPNYLTYPFLIKASARLSCVVHGVAVHAHAFKTGHESDVFICNSLIHMYSSCGCGFIQHARKVFDQMLDDKNLVSWNSMLDGYAKCGDFKMARQLFESMPPDKDVISWSCLIDGYVKSGEYREALSLFQRMQVMGYRANEVTMVSVLCACANLGALELGRSMHHYLVENRLPLTLVLLTSLVDMYAKCGAVKEALDVFHNVVRKNRLKTDVLFWNAIIGGLATHGYVQESLDLFGEMQRLGIAPDEITYLCCLSACAHGGLVKEAWHFLKSIQNDGMTPKSEHYACMVDVLARSGWLTEAYQFICEMPMEPSPSMLGALLHGCTNHRRFDLAETVGKRLIELEPDHDGRYVGLSNIYAADQRWDDARTMREAMETVGVKKSPGCSSVEIAGGGLHTFAARDKTHPESWEIYKITTLIIREMKEADLDDGGVFAYTCADSM